MAERLLRSFLGLDSETATLIMILKKKKSRSSGRIHEIFDIRCSYSGPRSGGARKQVYRDRAGITGAVLRSLIAGSPERKKKEGRKNEKKDKERERRVGPAVPPLGNINKYADGITDPRPLEARRRSGWVGVG